MAETDNSAMNLQYAPSHRANAVRNAKERILSDVIKLLVGSKVDTFSESSVAANLGYSERQFRRIWWEAAGEPLGSFARRIRLERAAGMLSNSTVGIAEVAGASGFSSVQAFTKAFRSHFECSPTEFKNLNHGIDCLFPGFLLRTDLKVDLPSRVKLKTGLDGTTTYVYEGPILLAKVYSTGRIDWRPR